jgi:hypothetical protein
VAARAPELLEGGGLLLIGPMAGIDARKLPPPLVAAAGALLAAALPWLPAPVRRETEAGAASGYKDPGVPARIAADPLRAQGALRLDTARALPAVRAPALVLHGAADASVPLAVGEAVRDRSAGAARVLAVYAGAFHTLFAEQADTVERVVQDLAGFVVARAPRAAAAAAELGLGFAKDVAAAAAGAGAATLERPEGAGEFVPADEVITRGVAKSVAVVG